MALYSKSLQTGPSNSAAPRTLGLVVTGVSRERPFALFRCPSKPEMCDRSGCAFSAEVLIAAMEAFEVTVGIRSEHADFGHHDRPFLEGARGRAERSVSGGKAAPAGV